MRISRYLTQDDWIAIQDRFSSSDPFGSKDSGAARIPLALQLIGKAHELHASGHVRQAVIDATTALEIAIGNFLRSCGVDPSYQDEFEKCRFPLRLVIVAQASRAVDPQLLKEAIEGIEMRNKIVHEGANPREDYLPKLAAMMKCAITLLGFKDHKTPNLGGNFLHAPEDTEAISGRGDVA